MQLKLPNRPFMRIDETAMMCCRSKRTIRRWLFDDSIDLHPHYLPSGGIVIPTTAVAKIIRLTAECYVEDDE